MLLCAQSVPNMPKNFRYSLGENLQKKVMEILLFVYKANKTQNKMEFLQKMAEEIVEVKVYIRLLTDLRAISEGKYAEMIDLAQSISKQIAAWEKYVKQQGSKMVEKWKILY